MRRSLLRKNAGGGFDFGNALDFANSTESLIFNTTLQTGTGDFILNYWIKPSITTVSKWSYYGLVSSHLQYRSNGAFRWKANGGNNNTFSFSNPLTVGVWSMVTLFRTSGVNYMAIDAVISASNFSFTTDEPFAKIGSTSNSDLGVYDEGIFKAGFGAVQADLDNLYNSGAGVDSSTIVTSPDQHFKLNESGTDTTAVDSSGNGNDGTLTNFMPNNGILNNFPASGMWVTGLLGNSLFFNGINEYVSLLSNVGLANDMTYSTWIYPTNIDSMLWGQIGSSAYCWLINTSSLNVRIAGTGATYTLDNPITLNQWNHLAITRKASDNSVRVYIDSVITLDSPKTLGALNPIINILGKWDTDLTHKFYGNMDETAFWITYEGTQTDINNLYNGGLGVDASSIISSPEWHLKFNEEGTDTKALDSANEAWVAH